MKTCLGDSLTYGYGVRRSHCWVSQLAAASGEDWRNEGINGDTTGGMLARLGEILTQKPRLICLMGGYNDILIADAGDSARANLMALAHQCAARGVSPCIGIPPLPRLDADTPWNDLLDLAAAQPKLEAYVLWLRRFAQVFGFPAIDFEACFAPLSAQARAALYLQDGLHINAEGHRLMAEQAYQTLYPHR